MLSWRYLQKNIAVLFLTYLNAFDKIKLIIALINFYL